MIDEIVEGCVRVGLQVANGARLSQTRVQRQGEGVLGLRGQACDGADIADGDPVFEFRGEVVGEFEPARAAGLVGGGGFGQGETPGYVYVFPMIVLEERGGCRGNVAKEECELLALNNTHPAFAGCVLEVLFLFPYRTIIGKYTFGNCKEKKYFVPHPDTFGFQCTIFM